MRERYRERERERERDILTQMKIRGINCLSKVSLAFVPKLTWIFGKTDKVKFN